MKPRPYVVRPSAREIIAILPPGWNKRIDKNPYKQIWKQARSRLKQCKSVVILGYSLPETDLLARGLFAEVVRRRATGGKWLKQLHVANPSPDAIQRLVDMFTPVLGANGSVFNPEDIGKVCAWEKNVNVNTAVQNSVSWTEEATVLLVNLGYISHFPKPVGHPAVRMLSNLSSS